MQTRGKSLLQKMIDPLCITEQKATSSVELPVEIDFDEASRAWNANKRRVGPCYYYVCGHILANGKDICKNLPKKNSVDFHCHIHS
jgi:hypothetical protein